MNTTSLITVTWQISNSYHHSNNWKFLLICLLNYHISLSAVNAYLHVCRMKTCNADGIWIHTLHCRQVYKFWKSVDGVVEFLLAFKYKTKQNKLHLLKRFLKTFRSKGFQCQMPKLLFLLFIFIVIEFDKTVTKGFVSLQQCSIIECTSKNPQANI